MHIPLLSKFIDYLDEGDGVQIVANDLQLTAELMLLIRVMFADGKLLPEEMTSFKKICATAFDIPEGEMPRVLDYLNEIGYETSVADAAQEFADMDMERKRALLLHMYTVAKADNNIVPSEMRIIKRTAEVLGIKAEDLLEGQS